MIHLINDSHPITVKWDGKEYELTKEPLPIEKGVAEHWMKQNPEAKLRVEEIAKTAAESRTPANPLEENNRGETFSALKKPRGQRAKASGE